MSVVAKDVAAVVIGVTVGGGVNVGSESGAVGKGVTVDVHNKVGESEAEVDEESTDCPTEEKVVEIGNVVIDEIGVEATDDGSIDGGKTDEIDGTATDEVNDDVVVD